MTDLDELQALIDRTRRDYCSCHEAYKIRNLIAPDCESCNTKDEREELADALEALRGEVIALRRVIEEAEDYLSNADHDAAQALLWETLHPGSAAHDAAIDAAIQSTERGEK